MLSNTKTSKPKPKLKKTKSKKSKGKVISKVGGDVRRGHWLFRQIKILDRQIKHQTDRCEQAEQENRVYDTKLLKKLIADRENVVREYINVPDPLGLLPPLPQNGHKKASQPRSKAPKDSSAQSEKSKTTSTGKGKKTAKVSVYLSNFYERVLWTGHPPTPKRTEKRYYWNEED